MRALLLTLQIFLGICLVLLPVAVFRRTWMFRVGITKKDHRTTRRLMIEWMMAGMLGALLLCGVPVLQTLQDKRTHELDAARDTLEQQSRGLESRLAHSETERAKLMRGGTHYLYDGSTITTRHYKGRETIVLQRMEQLQKARNWSELAAVAERQIARTPKWLTPYLFLGQACVELGHTAKARANLEHVRKNAPLDPAYRLAQTLLTRLPPPPPPPPPQP